MARPHSCLISIAPVVGREKEEKGRRREMFVGFCHVCAFCLCILQTSDSTDDTSFQHLPPPSLFHIYSQLELVFAFGATSVSLITLTLLQENMRGNDTAHIGSAALFGSWPELSVLLLQSTQAARSAPPCSLGFKEWLLKFLTTAWGFCLFFPEMWPTGGSFFSSILLNRFITEVNGQLPRLEMIWLWKPRTQTTLWNFFLWVYLHCSDPEEQVEWVHLCCLLLQNEHVMQCWGLISLFCP